MFGTSLVYAWHTLGIYWAHPRHILSLYAWPPPGARWARRAYSSSQIPSLTGVGAPARAEFIRGRPASRCRYSAYPATAPVAARPVPRAGPRP